MITITEKAEEYFRALLSKQAPETGIRVFVSNPGTPGVECGILYCPKNSVSFQDDIFRHQGFNVVIDRMSQPYLENAVIDYEDAGNGHGMTPRCATSWKATCFAQLIPPWLITEDLQKSLLYPRTAW